MDDPSLPLATLRRPDQTGPGAPGSVRFDHQAVSGSCKPCILPAGYPCMDPSWAMEPESLNTLSYLSIARLYLLLLLCSLRFVNLDVCMSFSSSQNGDEPFRITVVLSPRYICLSSFLFQFLRIIPFSFILKIFQNGWFLSGLLYYISFSSLYQRWSRLSITRGSCNTLMSQLYQVLISDNLHQHFSTEPTYRRSYMISVTSS